MLTDLTKIDRLLGRLDLLFSSEKRPKLQHVQFAGFDIAIENPKGSTRSGTDKDGHDWSIKMKHAYGYIKNTKGEDGEGIDVYIGPNEGSKQVFVVEQNDPATGDYDEDKVMLGFNTAKEAKKAYLDQYDRPGFFSQMFSLTLDEFRKLYCGNLSKKAKYVDD